MLRTGIVSDMKEPEKHEESIPTVASPFSQLATLVAHSLTGRQGVPGVLTLSSSIITPTSLQIGLALATGG